MARDIETEIASDARLKVNKAASDQAHPFVLTRHNLTVLFRL
jgi:hypothetical protein